MTAETEVKDAPEATVNAPATEVEKEAPKEPSLPKQTKCVILTGFGGPKYFRVQQKDQKTVGKGEVAIDVEAW
ncbi:unnamed protein product [Rodentolepis nana]|uniref:PTMS n=1 Tax=Rodentolepis nana TaxID=102285 RepID=A0A0R3TGD5_RODNA|nr:unnamed protein product [Rodentolepis nana]